MRFPSWKFQPDSYYWLCHDDFKMQTPVVSCTADIWDKFILRPCLSAMLRNFFFLPKGRNTTNSHQSGSTNQRRYSPVAVSNAVYVLRKMELAIERLHEHERLMDKHYFEDLVKSDMFLLRGVKSGSGTPLT